MYNTVAYSLGHGDNVGHDAMILKAPIVGARAAKARLNFVRDDEAARRAHQLGRAFDKIARKLHRTAHALYWLGKKCGQFTT